MIDISWCAVNDFFFRTGGAASVEGLALSPALSVPKGQSKGCPEPCHEPVEWVSRGSG